MFKIPEKMREVYLKNRVADLALLREALNKKSLEDFHRVGHQLAGNARNFGYEDLEAIALRMERLVDGALEHDGSEVLDELTRWLNANGKILPSSCSL